MSQKMPSDLRLVVPATPEEFNMWMAQSNMSHDDLYRVAAASRLEVLPDEVTTEQRSLVKVMLLSTFY